MYRINAYLHYLQSHVQNKSCLPQILLSFLKVCIRQLEYRLWQYTHIKARSPSQDVVDGPGSGALRCAGLRVRATRGEGGRVPQGRRSAGGLHRGQAVHDAGEALQTGGSSCLQCPCKEEDRCMVQHRDRFSLNYVLLVIYLFIKHFDPGLTVFHIRVAVAVVCIHLLPHWTVAVSLQEDEKPS